uniref:Hypoxanthine-guanine phosphoribosyltransferase (EC) n=2 Tax=uncultured Thiotrichaceae bacterium TaxID=298394 RepID=A0A6S6T244_9GAMM|nr:MAG: Hypoxanthine-guanine phosphoribosyltransferase (EC [uncultured Thiotrichaceae bacterium]
MKKQFLDEEQLVLDSFRLGVSIFESGFRPTFIVGLWRGGSTIGIYVQECLQTLGVETDHISLRTSYRGQEHYLQRIGSAEPEIRVHGTQYLLENLNADDGLLIVDDVFSTGHSVEAVINRLSKHLKRNMPKDVRIATLYQRPALNKTDIQPDYSLHSTDDWLVFPYEMSGLSMDEIREHKSYLNQIIQDMEVSSQ